MINNNEKFHKKFRWIGQLFYFVLYVRNLAFNGYLMHIFLLYIVGNLTMMKMMINAFLIA